MEETLSIVYRDEHYIAINKPSGLLVHRSEIDRRETRFAIQLLRNQIGQHVYPAHRLDKPTSGVLLFGLSQDAGRKLTEVFTDKLAQKTYHAIVRGYTEEAGHIDHALSHMLDRIADRDADWDKPAQDAVTDYRRLATVELPYAVDKYPSSRYSLVELSPKTGRKHQLRRHMKHIAHPIIGDTSHGKSSHNHFFAETFGIQRLLLAATELSFPHPYSQETTTIQAPLGEDYSSLVERLGWQSALPAHLLNAANA